MTNSGPNRYDVVGSFASLASVPAGQRASGQASGVGTHVDIAEQRHQCVPFLQNH